MKKFLTILLILLSFSLYSQTYLISDGGTVNACTGIFYDSGGAGSSYSSDEDYTYTICTNDELLVVTFTSMVIKKFDILNIYDGPTTGDPLYGTFTDGSFSGYMEATSGCFTFHFTSNGNQDDVGWVGEIACYRCGDLYCDLTYEDCFTCSNDCGPCDESDGGPYYHPTDGLQNQYVGRKMTPTCSGTYYDDGGDLGQYSNDVNNIYRTFCPDEAGKLMQLTFTRLDLEYTLGPPTAGCYDYIYIIDGPTQNGTILWQGCGDDLASILTVSGAWGTGVFTSTDPSGCITVRFKSDVSNTVYEEGWIISLNCIDGVGPNGTDDNDCSNATPLCTDEDIASFSTGPGITSTAGGCAVSENYTNWYTFEISSDGTLSLEIAPHDATEDYDFALFKASSCATLTQPVRCSFAALTPPGKTGMISTSTDYAEDVTGDQWVSDIDVIAGETYYLLVNLWTPNGDGFTLDWTLTDGASMDCAIMPVEMLYIEGDCDNKVLRWVTASEHNNDYFEIQHTLDGRLFQHLDVVHGHGNSNTNIKYEYPIEKNGLYRLKQVDFDGQYKYSDLVSVYCKDIREFIAIPNPVEKGKNWYIDGLIEGDQVVVMDISGRTMITKNLPAGVYIIMINGNYQTKLVIQ